MAYSVNAPNLSDQLNGVYDKSLIPELPDVSNPLRVPLNNQTSQFNQSSLPQYLQDYYNQQRSSDGRGAYDENGSPIYGYTGAGPIRQISGLTEEAPAQFSSGGRYYLPADAVLGQTPIDENTGRGYGTLMGGQLHYNSLQDPLGGYFDPRLNDLSQDEGGNYYFGFDKPTDYTRTSTSPVGSMNQLIGQQAAVVAPFFAGPQAAIPFVTGEAGGTAPGGGPSRQVQGPDMPTYGTNAPSLSDQLGGFDLSSLLGLGIGAVSSNDAAQRARELSRFAQETGAPSRSRYEASMSPGFDPSTIPGYSGAVDNAMQAQLRALSTQGNPFGNPGGLIEANKNVIQGTAMPAINAYRNQNLTSGGYQPINASIPLTAMNANNARSSIFDLAGAQTGRGGLLGPGGILSGGGNLSDWLRRIGGGGGIPSLPAPPPNFGGTGVDQYGNPIGGNFSGGNVDPYAQYYDTPPVDLGDYGSTFDDIDWGSLYG